MRLRPALVTCATLAAVVALSGACGIDVVGSGAKPDALDRDATAADDGASVDGASPDAAPDASADATRTPDASVDANIDAGPCTTTDTTCTAALAPGWKPIAFAANRSAACPAGYTTTDLVTSPVASAGACACACAIAPSDPPTCAKGSFTAQVGSNSCNTTGLTYNVNGTGCTPLPGGGNNLSTYAKYAALPLTPGTCNSTVQKDATKLTTTAVRACEPPAACREDACLGNGLGAFGSCIAYDGDVACPAGPFVNKTLAAPSASLTCGGCTSCTNKATCGAATLRFYNDAVCATELASRLVNGACNPVSGTAGAYVTYYRYDAATTGASCTPGSNPTTATALDVPRTICCR